MINPKIKILYVHNISQISGGERSLLNLWANLDRSQFDPYLILPEDGPLAQAARTLNVEVSFLPVPQLHPKNTLKLFKTIQQLTSFIKSKQIDIIHSYTPRNNILSALAARLSQCQVIWHERNMIFDGETDRSRQFYFLADCIICNSRAVAKRFEGKNDFAKKVRVILNGVDLESFKASEDKSIKVKLGIEGYKIVGMVTNLNKRKRIEYLLEIAELIIKDNPQVKFLIVGGEFPDQAGERIKELQTLAKKLGIDRQIIFTDFQEDVRPYLNCMDIFVHVTLKEACSRAILEAMAMQRPVIAADDGGNPELIVHGQSGFLINPQSKEAFANQIQALLADEPKALQIGIEARKRVEELFSVKRNTQETQNLYLELCHSVIPAKAGIHFNAAKG